MSASKTILIAAIFSIAAFAAEDVRAEGEMLGKWRLSGVPYELELFADGGIAGGSAMSGTVDQTTGEVHLRGYIGWTDACDVSTSIDGWISLDGRSLEADVVWAARGEYGAPCWPSGGHVQGTRCGNGIVDAWEECDHSPYWEDCCSNECTFAAEGVACNVVDRNACTDDICDGAGTCLAFNSTAACTPDGNCGTGACSDGACGVVQPFDAGTSCDLDENLCTPDVCDGTGQCAASPPLDCAPCSNRCDPSIGCWTRLPSDTVSQCDSDLRASLDVQTAESSGSSLKLTMKGEVTRAALGDPTASTSYTLCLTRMFGNLQDGIGYPVGQIEIPAEDQCDGDDCWRALAEGFLYRKKDTTGDGMMSARLTSRGLRLKAGGAPITLPETLPGPFTPPGWRYLAKLVASDGESEACWAQFLTPTVDTSDRFKGRGLSSEP
jgi:hypothetical protein